MLVPSLATVVVATNGLDPEIGKRQYQIKAPAVVGGVKTDLIGELPAVVRVNGRQVGPADLIRAGELVEIVVDVRDPVSLGTLAVNALGGATILGTVGVFIVNAVVFAGYTALMRGITRHFAKDDSRGQRPVALPVYSVENGANIAREFGSIPLIMGRMRVYPDLSARPFAELYQHPEEVGEIVDRVPTQYAFTPGYGVDWTPLAGNPDIFEQPDPIPAGAVNLVINGQASASWNAYGPQQPHRWLYNQATGDYMLLPDWQAAGGVWNGTQPPEYQIAYEIDIEDIDHRRRLTQIYGFGWGDLEILDERIIDTPIFEYRGVTRQQSVHGAFGAVLRQYPGRNVGAYTFNDTTNYFGESINHYPEAVWTEEGATLRRNDVDGPQVNDWVHRTSPRDTIHAQIDITGRLHRIQGGNITMNEAVLEIEYRAEPVHAAATGQQPQAWTPAPGSPMVVRNFDINHVQVPFVMDFPAPGYWDVRIRQVTADSDDGNNVIELEASEFRFQRNFAASTWDGATMVSTRTPTAQPALGFDTRGQNRMGLVIQTSEQISGIVDRFNAIVQARTWTYTGGGAWDGTYPRQIDPGGNNQAWRWQHTREVADWFLFFALGGYYLEDAIIVGDFAGWIHGPHANAGELLFGCGLQHEQIDYDSVLAWREWCINEGLKFDAIITDAEPAYITLNKIAAVGRASVSWASGKCGLVWEDKTPAVTAMFNGGNMIIDSFEIDYVSGQLPDGYRATYTDQEDDRYEQRHVDAYRPGVTALRRDIGQMDLFGVTERQQAWRAARIEAARTFYQRRQIKWRTDIEGFHTVRGDVVILAHDLTRWAINSRLFAIDGQTLELAKCAQWDGSGPLFAAIQCPDGTIVSGEVETWTGEAETVTLIGDWFPAALRPDADDQYGAESDPFLADNLGPEDYTIHIGPQATPGKRVRVTEVTPQQDGTFELQATDEYAELWLHDVGDEEFTPPDDPAASSEHVHPVASDCALTRDGAGRLMLEWELDGANAAQITVSINGGPWTSAGAVHGREVEIPDYPPGTSVQVSITPLIDAQDVAIPYPRANAAHTCALVVPQVGGAADQC